MNLGLTDFDVSAYMRDHRLDALVQDDARALPPNWSDLTRLHFLVLSRKVTTILEFGCGYSSLILASALATNARRHGQAVKSLRRNNPFELHSVDDLPEFIEIARNRLGELNDYATFHQSSVGMCSFEGRIATQYEKLPNICPDLIYLDGPSQDSVLGEISGISTRHKDRFPMSCDLLKIEHFLLPGTLLVVDGRAANARFLRCNLQRNWSYQFDESNDVHYFELYEAPLGQHNRRMIEFCLGADWLRELE